MADSKASETVKVTVAYNDGIPTYTVEIKDFKNKMKTWPSGKFIKSESFAVNDVPLSLIICPNGDIEKNKGNVSVFLKNNSDGNTGPGNGDGSIQLDLTLKMKGDEFKYSMIDFGPKQALGITAFYCHKGVVQWGFHLYSFL